MDDSQALQGIEWWNGLTEEMRRYWLDVAGTAVPADAWKAYVRSLDPLRHEN